MKTLLLISNAVPHYRVSVYNYLSKRFLDHGWQFVVASDAMQAESKQQVRFEFRELPFRFAGYRRLVDELRPDAVMFHLHIKDCLFWQLIHWVRAKRIPIISWTKGANLDRPKSRLRYHLFNYFHDLSDALILYSKKQLEVIKPRNHSKVYAANNTVNFHDYPDIQATRDQIKAEFKIPFEKIVLFAGTMGIDGERKKVDHLIQIFQHLPRKDIGLILVGGGLSAERQARLNSNNTLYLGKVHDPLNVQISKLFKAADLVVIPGHVGLAVNQAFYWGVPLLTEDGLHPPEIQYVRSGRNGFIVAENDLIELEAKMLYLLDNDSVRAEFSQNAREDILRDASIEAMFTTFHQAILSAVEKVNRKRKMAAA